jgi:hypothetical protein
MRVLNPRRAKERPQRGAKPWGRSFARREKRHAPARTRKLVSGTRHYKLIRIPQRLQRDKAASVGGRFHFVVAASGVRQVTQAASPSELT